MDLLTYSHDTQAPDVNLWSVFLPRNDFGSHPVRSPNHRRSFRLRWIGNLRTEPEIGYIRIRLACRSNKLRDCSTY